MRHQAGRGSGQLAGWGPFLGTQQNSFHDNPADEILSEADQGDYDLVVVGVGGASQMKHSILGSVSTKVAWARIATGRALMYALPSNHQTENGHDQHHSH